MLAWATQKQENINTHTDAAFGNLQREVTEQIGAACGRVDSMEQRQADFENRLRQMESSGALSASLTPKWFEIRGFASSTK